MLIFGGRIGWICGLIVVVLPGELGTALWGTKQGLFYSIYFGKKQMDVTSDVNNIPPCALVLVSHFMADRS